MLVAIALGSNLGDREAHLTFAVRRLGDGQIVGSTRYHAIDLPNRALEVGGTWYVASARGTFVNPAQPIVNKTPVAAKSAVAVR